VAKILVADDNSNVHKTVALALADLGVEVFSVNNGDAAVRKLADVSPDLVLADIFMPVRNGYEVCEYIKKDSRFSHVPVVLLVGAFDPLDEREAQRVGADGILKKPFVPPDPLIMMVKTLLDRTLGDRLMAVGVSKPAVPMQGKAGGVATAEEPPSASVTSDELPMEEFRPPVDRLSFGEGERPIAFGQLLETTAKESAATGSGVVEPFDNEQILTGSRDASLGDPIFWRPEEPEPQTEEENSEAEGDISAGIPMREWKLGEEAQSGHAEADILQPVEPFELVREEKDEESGQTSTIVESSPLIVQDAASQASLTVEAARPEDLAANPLEWMASVSPPPAEETPEAAPERSAAVTEATDSDKTDVVETNNLETTPAPVAPESMAAGVAPPSVSVPAPEPPSSPTPAQPSMKLLAQSAEDTARSIPKQDWADLAASLLPKPIEPVTEMPKPSPAPLTHPLSVHAADAPSASTDSARSVSKPMDQSAEDTARSIPMQDWADLAASLLPKLIEPIAEKPKPADAPVAQVPAVATANAQPASATSAPPVTPDPALVEAVVQRILDKMRPQVVDIITKEFLRPIVQALVHREIEKH
jgi:CheY-like chemotaxis protein